jgi:hypothetical protein
MTTLSANRISQLHLPLADIEQLFRLRLQIQALGDLGQFAPDWLANRQQKYPRPQLIQHGTNIPSLADIKQFAKHLNGGNDSGWRKLALSDGDWQAAAPNLIDDYLRQALSACSMRLNEQHDRLIIAPLLALDILAIQPLIKHSTTLASHLTLDLLQAAVPALRYIDCESLLTRQQEAFGIAFRQSRQLWPDGNVLPWLRSWWNFLTDALDRFNYEADQTAIGTRRGSRRALIEFFVADRNEAFNLQQICTALPGVSRDMIRLVLAEMRQQRAVECSGRGRAALWKKIQP